MTIGSMDEKAGSMHVADPKQNGPGTWMFYQNVAAVFKQQAKSV